MGTRYTLEIENVSTNPLQTQTITHNFGRTADLLFVNLTQGDQRLEILNLTTTIIEIRNPSGTEVNISDLIFDQRFSVNK
jgi:hypothetical protein